MNTLILIGYLGGYTGYLNIPREEAVRRYVKETGEDEADFNVRVIRFKDELSIYDACGDDEE